MRKFKRYAIYYAPRAGAFADRAAAWLGYDCDGLDVDGLGVGGRDVAHPDLAGLPLPLDVLTGPARKYGFHGTIKPPFALAEGADADDLCRAVAALALGHANVTFDGLRLTGIGGFLALVPVGDPAPLLALGADVVATLDRFRAPLSPADIARRRPERLTPQQRLLLDRWGYPYVMDEFRFHLTLTGDIGPAQVQAVQAVAQDWFGPVLPVPFRIDDLCLFGEAADGRFHLLHRYALSG